MTSASLRLIALLAVLCSACATAHGPKFTPPTDLDPDAALIYVYRGGGVVGADRSYSILANDEYIGTFAQYAYTMFETKDSSVSFSWAWESRNYGLRFAGMLSGVDVSPELQGTTRLLSMNVEAGKAYFVKLTPTTRDAYASLKLSDPDEGMKEIPAYYLWADHWTDALTKGNAALGKGRNDEAESFYLTALAHINKAPLKCAEALTRNYLGLTYVKQQRHDEAEEQLRQSIAAWEACGGTQGLGITLQNYAAFLRSQGRGEEAAEIDARLEAMK